MGPRHDRGKGRITVPPAPPETERQCRHHLVWPRRWYALGQADRSEASAGHSTVSKPKYNRTAHDQAGTAPSIVCSQTPYRG